MTTVKKQLVQMTDQSWKSRTRFVSGENNIILFLSQYGGPRVCFASWGKICAGATLALIVENNWLK